MCNDPDQAPNNGFLLFTLNENGTILVGDVAEYQCKNGYQLVGPDKKVCMEEGEWQPKDKVFCVVTG